MRSFLMSQGSFSPNIRAAEKNQLVENVFLRTNILYTTKKKHIKWKPIGK